MRFNGAVLAFTVIALSVSAGAGEAQPADPLAPLPENAAAIPTDAQIIMDWVLASRDNNGRPYMVIDKRAAQVLVFDASGQLAGIFSLRDVRLALLGTADLGPLVIAGDIAHRPPLTVTPEDDLHTALKRMTELNVDELPVVPDGGPPRLLGLLG